MTELRRILYVEDEEDIQTLVRLSLENLSNYELRICSSGEEALEEALHFEPDLFLLDVMMPDMDGPTTLKELRKMPQFQNTPAVFITAKAQVHEVIKYKEIGALDVIVKPFDIVELPVKLRTIWENRNA
jgi:two-component system, OmpR family, response regulator